MILKKLVRLGAATLLSLSSLLTLSIPLVHATQQTCVWTGGGSDNNFSTTANWSSCGGGAPLAGDIISFGLNSGSSSVSLTNDLGVSLGGVISTPATNSQGYIIDTISLTSGASLSDASSSDCAQWPVRIIYSAVTAAGDLTVNTDGNSIDSSNLSVAGNLTLTNSVGYGALAANAGSTVTGNVIVASPTPVHSIACGSGGGSGANPTGSSLSGFTVNGLTVQKGASVALGDVSFPITLGGGSGTGNPQISFYGNQDQTTFDYVATTYTVSGALTLTSDATLYAGDLVTLNLTSAISGSGFALSADPTSTGDITFSPSSNDSNTTTGSQANAPQTVTVSDSQTGTSVTAVPNETLILDGDRGFVQVLRGATLEGTGSATDLLANTGSIVAPGHSPGCLTVDNLTLNGTYQAQLGGTVACTGYDQIKVTSGATTVDITGATLDASLYNGFVPAVGQSYTIISNASSTAVTGTFAGIAEGGTYTNQGVTYSVTYKGGAGNDVVLTVTAVDASLLPKKPNTGMQLVAAHPAAAFGTSVVAALTLVYAARRLKPARR